MTDEQKKKMAEGRAKAALERKNAASIVPKDLPAGHDRDEARKMVADHLEERAETEAADLGIEAIDASKLKQKDNEIQRHIVRKGPQSGTIPVENPQRGYRYMRHSVIGAFEDNSARAAVRLSLENAKSWGYEFVKGDDPEDSRFDGNDCAAGTSMRGIADTLLMRISEENYQRMMQYDANRRFRQGQVEERLAVIGQQVGLPTHVSAGDFSKDPYMSQMFGKDKAAAEVYRSNFNEGDMRRGSIPGIPAPGAR